MSKLYMLIKGVVKLMLYTLNTQRLKSTQIPSPRWADPFWVMLTRKMALNCDFKLEFCVSLTLVWVVLTQIPGHTDGSETGQAPRDQDPCQF